jgi:hypothetical protein
MRSARRTFAARVDDAVAERFLVARRKRDQLPDDMPKVLPYVDEFLTRSGDYPVGEP